MLNGASNLAYRWMTILGTFFYTFRHRQQIYLVVPRLNQVLSKSILTDHATIPHSSTVGGFILWDWTYKVIKVVSIKCGHTSILVVEARALRDEVYLAVQVGYEEISMEGDNMIAIKALTGIN